MSKIVLYTNPQSRGQIAQWMLEELGEPYETQWIDYGEPMKSPEYLAINPMGKVPAMVHDGKTVTECPAICAFLAAAYPAKKLMPTAGDPALADYFRWLFFAAGPLEQAITYKSLNLKTEEESSRMLGFGTYEDTIDVLDGALQEGPYICGEQFTAADVYVGSHVFWGLQFGSLESRDSFEAYAELVKSRPALHRAQKINEEKMGA